jgi:subtilisin family serine protease
MKTIFMAGLLALYAALPVHAGSNASMPAAEGRTEAASRQILVMLRIPPQHYHPDAAYAGRYPNDSGRAARQRTAQELAAAHGLTLLDDWPMPVIGIDCYVMQQNGEAPLERVLAALSRDPRVAWAQPMHTYEGLDTGQPETPGSRDPLYPLQPAARYWRVAELHKASTGRDIRIAVIDSGVDSTHPDLAGQVQLRENFVDGVVDSAKMPAEAHGTAVAGIIAAREGNGIGIAGVAPDARLMALRACWQDKSGATRCSSFTLAKALNFAVMNRARIINLSLSGPADSLLASLIEAARARGMAVVGAFDPRRADGGFPASHPGVIAVAAAVATTANAAASQATLVAPGTDIPTTAPGARWNFVSGPSYAAAHVAGLVALIAQLQPAADAQQLRSAIVTAPVPARVWSQVRHTTASVEPAAQAGNIDACASVARITGACACSCPTISVMSTSSKP